MVRSWKRQDELTRLLKGLVDLDSALGEIGGGDHRDNVQQNVWVFLKDEAKLLLDCFFELFPVLVGNTVPHLRLTPMAVVDRVKHKVFVVPTESRILHSDVQPRNVDPTDVVLAGELHQRVELARKVVQVPWMVNVVLLT